MILHHEVITGHFDALEVASLVDELGVDVLVDAGHAEDMPAIVDIEEDVSVDVFVILSVALPTFDYFGLINCQVFVHIYLVYFALSLGQAIELIKNIA